MTQRFQRSGVAVLGVLAVAASVVAQEAGPGSSPAPDGAG